MIPNLHQLPSGEVSDTNAKPAPGGNACTVRVRSLPQHRYIATSLNRSLRFCAMYLLVSRAVRCQASEKHHAPASPKQLVRTNPPVRVRLRCRKTATKEQKRQPEVNQAEILPSAHEKKSTKCSDASQKSITQDLAHSQQLCFLAKSTFQTCIQLQ